MSLNRKKEDSGLALRTDSRSEDLILQFYWWRGERHKFVGEKEQYTVSVYHHQIWGARTSRGCFNRMNQQCKVCGEPAAGFHFGAFTCEGCKLSTRGPTELRFTVMSTANRKTG
ncbi:unnamed protein product [Bemisia tabaci]|uniref:Nuclear receptor domain-containing protein n=1 Tax=Bemisia tabaci TaxID=7038 RepID=A0A9P0A6B5_BEMTA|nr:unnamed protein product [Bemisia tabaci]